MKEFFDLFGMIFRAILFLIFLIAFVVIAYTLFFRLMALVLGNRYTQYIKLVYVMFAAIFVVLFKLETKVWKRLTYWLQTGRFTIAPEDIEKKYKLIVFDMDGTILNTLDDMQASVNFALEKNGLPTRTIDEVKWFLGQGVQVLIHKAVPEGTSEEVEQKVLKDFLPYYSEHSADKTVPYAGITKVAKKLKSFGYWIAVNSNKPDKEAGVLAEHYFPGVFNFVLGSRPELEKKPSSDGINFLAKEFDVERDEIIYIGDSDIDLQTAQNSRATFIGCDWGFRGRDFLLEHGAKYVAMKPSELVKIISSL